MEALRSLIEKAQDKDLDAFGRIVKRFQDMAVGYAYSILGDFHLAEDVAQEAFIEAYQCLPKLNNPDAFSSWFRKIVFRQCTRVIRSNHVETVPLEKAYKISSGENDPTDEISAQEQKDNVLSAIQSLTEDQRVVTTLFYINGYTQDEISNFLEIPVTTVKKRLQYSRKRLKERMIRMVKDTLYENRPSKDDQFSDKVQLFNTVELCEIEKVKELISKDHSLINAKNDKGQTPLHIASYYGYKDVMQYLLTNSADVDVKDKDGRTSLHLLVERDNTPDVAEILIEKGANINATDSLGLTPLILAMESYDEILARYLISKGAEVDIHSAVFLVLVDHLKSILKDDPSQINARIKGGSYFSTPLHVAVSMLNVAMVKLLLEYGADINVTDDEGHTPLHIIYHSYGPIWRGTRPEMTELLLSHGAKLDIFSGASLGQINYVRQLLSENPELVNAKDNSGSTPLHWAVLNNQKEMVELLVENGANVNAIGNNDATPIKISLFNKNKEIEEYLLNHGAKIDVLTATWFGMVDKLNDLLREDPSSINTKTFDGLTLLEIAALGYRRFIEASESNGKPKRELPAIELLLSKGAELNIHIATLLGKLDQVAKLINDDPTQVNRKWLDGATPIYEAVGNGYTEIAEYLIKHGASIKARGERWSDLPIHIAAKFGHIDCVELLLKSGVDVNEKGLANRTPLHWSAFSGYLEIVKLLVSKGADINARDTRNGTPIYFAAIRNHIPVVEFFLNQGVDINIKGHSETTILHQASKNNHPELAKFLLDRGASLDVRDNVNNTPLHYAASHGRIEIAKLLLSRGADINDWSGINTTPLHEAAWNAQNEMAEFLLANGADINANRNNAGTPLQFAEQRGYKETAELLRRHGAK